MGKKQGFPPILIVTGSQHLLRRRFINEVTSTMTADGYRLDTVDGSNRAALGDVLGGGFLVADKVLAIIENPAKADLELLDEHATEADPQTVLLLHQEGEPDGRTKWGKWVKKNGAVHKSFPLPKSWNASEVATDFLVDEAKRHDMILARPLAQALVIRAGDDLGMLAFEILKMAALASADHSKEILGKHVKGGMAPIAEASVFPIVDALAARNQQKLMRALQRVRMTSKYDPTMKVARILASTVRSWVMAVYLDALPPKAAAQELGLNPWYFESKILPSAMRWGPMGTVKLAEALAASERAVLSGAISPWTVLSARLLAIC